MKRFLIQTFTFFLFLNLHSQETNPYQKGVSAERNLTTVMNVSPYIPGGVGFDNRYEGVKGSPRLFDKLIPGLLWIKNDNNYFQVNVDLDVFHNQLIFSHPKTGSLMSIPAEIVKEVIITVDGSEQKYRTTLSEKFDSDVKRNRFYMVMNEKHLFIRIPVKVFTEADYKNLYSPDRRYDEYELKYQYFLLGSDSVFHRVQPNQKTLLKLFPDYKDVIEFSIKGKKFANNDEMVLRVMENIKDSSSK